jgi:hypothetical protein
MDYKDNMSDAELLKFSKEHTRYWKTEFAASHDGYDKAIDDAIEHALSYLIGRHGMLMRLIGVTTITMPIGQQSYLLVTVIAEPMFQGKQDEQNKAR